MKTIHKLSLFLAILVLLTFSSCNNNDDAPAPTKTDMLTGAWKITKLETTIGETTIDGTADIEPCSSDDLIVFTIDGYFINEEGATKCFPDDPQVISAGTWAFNSDETQVTITEDGDITVLTIASLTDSEVVFTGMGDLDFDGQEDDTLTITATKQQ